MKISDIDTEYLKTYLRIDCDEDDKLLNHIISASKAYICNYTGLDEEEIEHKQDLGVAMLVICAEMYDNRQFTVNTTFLNPIAISILSMYSVNLL